MVVCDFNLICLNQQCPQFFESKDIAIEIVDKVHGGYLPGWKLLKSKDGIWYQFYPQDKFSNRTYADEFFDLGQEIGNTFSVRVIDNNIRTIEAILSFYLSQSPIHEICVMFWLDGDEKKEGVSCSFCDFKKRLGMDQILFGVLYHIYAYSDALRRQGEEDGTVNAKKERLISSK